MAQLSEQVKISLENSQKSLREALSFASKTESPYVNTMISQLMMASDQLIKMYDRPKSPFEEMLRKHLDDTK